MQMIPRAVPRTAHIADDLALGHRLSLGHRPLIHVGVQGGGAVAVPGKALAFYAVHAGRRRGARR